jgi:hypothetical protein
MSLLIVLFAAFLAQAPAPSTAPPEPYKAIALTEPDVKAAAKVALALTRPKGTLIAAERHAISADNIRLCISMNRSGDYEFARVVLSRDTQRKRWTVTVWSWGSCGR